MRILVLEKACSDKVSSVLLIVIEAQTDQQPIRLCEDRITKKLPGTNPGEFLQDKENFCLLHHPDTDEAVASAAVDVEAVHPGAQCFTSLFDRAHFVSVDFKDEQAVDQSPRVG